MMTSIMNMKMRIGTKKRKRNEMADIRSVSYTHLHGHGDGTARLGTMLALAVTVPIATFFGITDDEGVFLSLIHIYTYGKRQ